MSTTRRPKAALLGVAALALYGAAVAVPAQAASNTALITGVITGPSGTPAHDGTVSMIVWPNGATLDSIPNGPTNIIPTKVIATSSADSHGSYALHPNLGSLTNTYIEPDGTINFQIDANAGGVQQSYSMSAAEPGSEAAKNLLGDMAVPGSTVDKVAFNMQASTVTAQLGTTAMRKQTAPASPSASNGHLRLNHPGVDGVYPLCLGWYSQSFWAGRNELWNDVYNYSGSVTVDQATSSAHETGVGVAVTGGSWHASGDVTFGVDSSASGSRVYHVNHAIYNQVNAHHYMDKCFNYEGAAPYWKHEVRMSSFHALFTAAPTISNRAWDQNYCNYYAGGTYTKTAGRDTKFATGFSAPFISLSAQASYSSHTTTAWSPTDAYLCGDSSAGWVSSDNAGAEPGEHCGPSTAVTAKPGVKPDC